MKTINTTKLLVGVGALTLAVMPLIGHCAEPRKIDDNGVMEFPAVQLPFSAFASAEAKAALVDSTKHPIPYNPQSADVAKFRADMDKYFNEPLIKKQQARYSVSSEVKTVNGVYTEVFTPTAGIADQNRDRILINLHGGGFVISARTGGRIESIPIAAVGKIKVISVDYRQGPENHFPAASEDVATVYRELLKSYKPENIGIYGCSAGGMLTAQAVAWFQKVNLPPPGAIGIFCASASRMGRGDSAYLWPIGAPPPSGDKPAPPMGYFAGANLEDPLVSPAISASVLAKFPPTLIITGTRAGDMSAAADSSVRLTKAGVKTQFLLWDGLGHAFFYNPDLPESRDMYDITVKFFAENLGKH